MARSRTIFAAALGLALAQAAPRPAHAYPQWTANATMGFGRVFGPAPWREWVFTMGLRGDVTFGPRTPFAWRAGPFIALRTDDFVSMSAAAGAVLQVPVSPTFPMVFSLGGVSDVLPETQRARRYGVLGRLWWGSRSLNYHRDYGMSVGLWCEIRHFTNEGSTDVVLGVDGDLAFMSLPVVMLYEAIRR